MRPAPPTQADAMRLLDRLFASSPIDNTLITAVIGKLADRDLSIAMTVIEVLLDEAGKRLPDRRARGPHARIRRPCRATLASQQAKNMPVVYHSDVAPEPFKGGATYQTLVGDEHGSTPIRVGIQTSPPGYKTPLHSHPYMETITVLEGQGEARLQDGQGLVSLKPGVTLVLRPNVRHWFRTTGDLPLKTYGIHASPHRIVNVHEE